MARLNVDESNIGSCPCGKGKIVERLVSSDHGWGAGSFSQRIECDKCNNEWEIQGSSLVNQESEREYKSSLKLLNQARNELNVEAARIVDLYFSSGKFKTMAAEHRELQRLGMFPESVAKYRQMRRSQGVGATAQSANDTAWFLSQCTGSEEQEVLRAILIRIRDLDRDAKEKESHIIRRPLGKSGGQLCRLPLAKEGLSRGHYGPAWRHHPEARWCVYTLYSLSDHRHAPPRHRRGIH